jgi:hypothetical protein
MKTVWLISAESTLHVILLVYKYVTHDNVTATGFTSVYVWIGIQDYIDINTVTSQPPASIFYT